MFYKSLHHSKIIRIITCPYSLVLFFFQLKLQNFDINLKFSLASFKIIKNIFKGMLHSKLCLEYGTNIVGGVNPKRKGEKCLKLPIFESCQEAKQSVGANASLLFVPAQSAKRAIIEAIEAEFKLIVAITEGIPQWDMVEVMQILNNQSKTRMIGPNCPGLIRVILSFNNLNVQCNFIVD